MSESEKNMIRKARPEELDRIMEIYKTAQDFMIATGNPTQWARNYPTRELISDDIAGERFYVDEEDGKIHGCFMFRVFEDPTYAKIDDGEWLSDEPYGVIHRVASDGTGHGVFASIVAFARARAEGLGLRDVRIDTHEDNKPMQHLVGKAGFAYCGIIHLADGDPRLAYQLTF